MLGFLRIDMTEQELQAVKLDALRWKTIASKFSVSQLNIDGNHHWRGPSYGLLVGATMEQAIDRVIQADIALVTR
jgi:hypothetical protein